MECHQYKICIKKIKLKWQERILKNKKLVHLIYHNLILLMKKIDNIKTKFKSNDNLC